MKKKILMLSSCLAIGSIYFMSSQEPLHSPAGSAQVVESMSETVHVAETVQTDSLEAVQGQSVGSAPALQRGNRKNSMGPMDLDQKLTQVEKEVSELQQKIENIDMEREMNSEFTSPERRREIVNLVNRFSMRMGELARLESQKLDQLEEL